MANEKRLIDANALETDIRAYADNKAYCGHIELANGILKALGRIDDAPTVDAVEVVRCKDCKYFKRIKTGYGECPFFDEIKDEEFCSSGERREGE